MNIEQNSLVELLKQRAEEERLRVEVAKFEVEQQKLAAERQKLAAETEKFQHDIKRLLSPRVAKAIPVVTAIAASFGAILVGVAACQNAKKSAQEIAHGDTKKKLEEVTAEYSKLKPLFDATTAELGKATVEVNKTKAELDKMNVDKVGLNSDIIRLTDQRAKTEAELTQAKTQISKLAELKDQAIIPFFISRLFSYCFFAPPYGGTLDSPERVSRIASCMRKAFDSQQPILKLPINFIPPLEDVAALEIANQWITLTDQNKGRVAKVIDRFPDAVDREKTPRLAELGTRNNKSLNFLSPANTRAGLVLQTLYLEEFKPDQAPKFISDTLKNQSAPWPFRSDIPLVK